MNLEVCNRIWLHFLFSPEHATSRSVLPFLDTLAHLHLILVFHLLFNTTIRFLARAAALISGGSRSYLQALHRFRNLLSRALPWLWKRPSLFPLHNVCYTLRRLLGPATASSTGSSRSHLLRLCYVLELAFSQSTFCMAKDPNTSSAHASHIVTSLLVRAASSVAGCSTSHTVSPSVLSGTCCFVLCLAYGRSFHLPLFTSFPRLP